MTVIAISKILPSCFNVRNVRTFLQVRVIRFAILLQRIFYKAGAEPRKWEVVSRTDANRPYPVQIPRASDQSIVVAYHAENLECWRLILIQLKLVISAGFKFT